MAGPNEHEGNVAFRNDAMQVLKESSGRWKVDKNCTKAEMATKVMERVHGRGGQFVQRLSKQEELTYAPPRQDSSSNLEHQTKGQATYKGKNKRLLECLYMVVALEKTKQSFRHQKRALKRVKQEHPSNVNAAASTVASPCLGSQEFSMSLQPPMVVDNTRLSKELLSAYTRRPTSHFQRVMASEMVSKESLLATVRTSKSNHVTPRVKEEVQTMQTSLCNGQSALTVPSSSSLASAFVASRADTSSSLAVSLNIFLEHGQRKHKERSMALLAARRSLLPMLSGGLAMTSSTAEAAQVAQSLASTVCSSYTDELLHQMLSISNSASLVAASVPPSVAVMPALGIPSKVLRALLSLPYHTAPGSPTHFICGATNGYLTGSSDSVGSHTK